MTDDGFLEQGVMRGGVHIFNRVIKASLIAIGCHDSRPEDGGT